MTDWRSQWQTAVIEAIDDETPTVKSFVLRPKQWAPFLPGQHVDVRLTADDDYDARRSYSLTSEPAQEDTLQVAIERLGDGEVSGWFHDVAMVGDTIETRGPFTHHFVWRPGSDGTVLLVGGGSGIAPMLSMVRHRATLADAPPMLLLYSARSWEHAIARAELVEHAAQQPGLRVFFALTRDARVPSAHAATVIPRRLNAAVLVEVIAALPALPHTSFVCGNNGFVNTVCDALLATGVPFTSIRTERFGGGA